MRSVADIDLKGKKVLVRCDFNVPMDHRRIVNTARIDASLETIQHILNNSAAVVLCSHLGRPKARTPIWKVWSYRVLRRWSGKSRRAGV